MSQPTTLEAALRRIESLEHEVECLATERDWARIQLDGYRREHDVLYGLTKIMAERDKASATNR